MDAEKKREYRLQMSAYQKKKYLEYIKKRYHALSPEKMAELLEKRRIYYEANKEKIRERQLEYYHKKKSKTA
jgi:prenyltransferase beta subunit